MNKMIEPFTMEDIKKAVHDFDLINRPYILYYNPKDNELLQKVVFTIGDKMVLQETNLIKPGQVLLADRTKVEEYYEEMIDYKNIGRGEENESFAKEYRQTLYDWNLPL